ncbi:hypothetical protein PV04_07664 [Phialophora macrospora]|uniref:Uncharacterized protein n=1 Tax=Phialophora macrospora TaxID=1851006 RepID=A0A0D2CJI6_9EURO|nr:hypothetical protein PV04_07664 [Phialophora macrospora]
MHPMADEISSSQLHHPSGFSPRHPSAYLPNNCAAAGPVWTVSLDTYLLFTLLAINLVFLLCMLSGRVKGWSTANTCSLDKYSAFYAVECPSWPPKVRLAWKKSGQPVRNGDIQGQGQERGLRLELDFTGQHTATHTRTRTSTRSQPGPVTELGPEASSAPTPGHASQNLKVEVKSLRFGVHDRLAPVQELDGDAVLMPRSKDMSERSARLRGGVETQTSADTEANTGADTDIDILMETETETEEVASRTIPPDAVSNRNIHDNHRIQHMRSFLQLEDHIEGVLQEFDELELHRTGSLLREALTRNERRRLIALYHRLERRMGEHMRALGVEVDGLEMELDEDEDGAPDPVEVLRSAGRPRPSEF